MKSLAGAVLMTGAAVAALTGCGANLTSTTYHGDNTYDVPGQIGKLKVKLDSDDVRIVGSDTTKKISVHERLSYTKNRKPTPHHTTEGGILSLGYRCPDGLTIGFNRCGVSYTIQVPRGTAVEVGNDSGKIVVSGVGDVDASLSSGDFLGTDLGGHANVDADSGNIVLKNVTGSVRARASSGNIVGENLRGGTANADADSGNVVLRFAAVPANVQVKASSGNIRLFVPGGQSYAVTAEVDSGNKSVDVPTDPASPNKIKAVADSGNVNVIPADRSIP